MAGGRRGKELDEISEGIVLVSMPGHTRGHHCVAVDAGHRWVLHCGDAFYHHGTLDGQSQVPCLLTRMETPYRIRSKTGARQPFPPAELYQREAVRRPQKVR